MAQPVPFFPALDDAAFAIQNEGFPSGFEVTTLAAAGRNVVTNTSFRKKGSKVSGQTGLSITNDAIPVDLEVQVSTSNECFAKISTQDFFTQGTGFALKSLTGKTGETTFDAELNFANDKFSVGGDITANYEKWALESATGHAVVQLQDNIRAGIQARCKSYFKWNGAVALTCANSEAQVNVTKKASNWVGGFSWYHNLSDSITYGAQFNFDITTPQKNGTSASVGGSWKLDDKTTFYGKWIATKKANHDAAGHLRLEVAAQQHVTSYCVATLGIDLNANKFLGRADAKGKDHSFGLKVSFE